MLQLSTFKKNCAELFSPADPLLLAVSGGLDSVVLCELCHQSGFTFGVAHANFGLRGQESHDDEAFVKQLALRYQAPFFCRQFDASAFAKSERVSVQVAARTLRYRWFGELMPAHGRWLLTAHHADDNVETMLMHFFRGTGIAGLRGMLPRHDRILRPMLPFTREMLLAYAREQRLQWREDSSNASDKYSRNYFRHHLIPLIKNIFPEAEQNLTANLSRFRDAETLYRQAIDLHKKKLLEYRGEEIHLPVLKLKKTEPIETILFEISRPFGFTAAQLPELLHLLDAPHGKYVSSPAYRIIRNRDWLIIAPRQAAAPGHILIEEGDTQISFPGGCLNLGFFKGPIEDPALKTSAEKTLMDRREIGFPLILRPWKAGDYFYPLGMKKKKKVARFLIDQKLSKTDKEKVWVLESQQRICWIVGLRPDDRFKITPSTREMLGVQLLK